MAFVPAGYYEAEYQEEDEFDFGDGIIQGQFEGAPIEVSPAVTARAASPLDKELRGFSLQQDGQLMTSPVSPVKGGKGSLSDCSLDLSVESSCSGSGNEHPRQANEGGSSIECSPIKFRISNSQCESENSLELSDNHSLSNAGSSVNSGGVKEAELLGGRGLGGGGALEPLGESDGGSAKSRGWLESLEAEEAMKLAVTKGNVDKVTKMLDKGVMLLGCFFFF